MQTCRYAWNADTRICVECRHSGMRAWVASVGKHELRERTGIVSSFLFLCCVPKPRSNRQSSPDDEVCSLSHCCCPSLTVHHLFFCCVPRPCSNRRSCPEDEVCSLSLCCCLSPTASPGARPFPLASFDSDVRVGWTLLVDVFRCLAASPTGTVEVCDRFDP